MEIPDISAGDIQIRQLNIPAIPTWIGDTPQSLQIAAPVTVTIGSPIVDIPGCVESHPDAGKNKKLAEEDPNGVQTYCDGTVPSFYPINYEPEQLILTKPEQKADTKQKEAPIKETPAPPTKDIKPPEPKVECPTPAQQAKEPVGTFVEGFRKKVTDYQLIGNQCIQITEPVSLPTQIIAGLPSAGSVMTTGGIAVVATTSALMAKPLADILLKAVKPVTKKIIKKIAAIRGKSVPVLSVAERREEQRERTQAIRALRSALKPKG